MPEETKRGLKEGLAFGVIAGIIFALVEVLVSAIMGNPPLMPFRMFASILLGQGALQTMSVGAAFVVGLIVHLVLSALFGLVYGAINAQFPAPAQTRWGGQAGIGIAFGILLWAVNFHVIGRLFYPWFLETPQFLQMVLHALFFGLPLALMYAGAERRTRRRLGMPATAS